MLMQRKGSDVKPFFKVEKFRFVQLNEYQKFTDKKGYCCFGETGSINIDCIKIQLR